MEPVSECRPTQFDGTVRVPAAIVQLAGDALRLSMELLDGYTTRRNREAHKLNDCAAVHSQTFPPEELTIIVRSSPAITLDNP